MMNQATKIVTTAGLAILVPLSMSHAAFANTTSPNACNQPQITINVLEENPKTGELTITHAKTVEAQQQETIDAILSDPNVVEAGIGQPVHAISVPQNAIPVKKKPKKAKQKLIKKYAPIYDIMYPAGDTLSQTLSAPKTNGISYPGHDPLFENQWYLTSTNIPAANTISQGANTVIAVLDSPINTSHPELASSVLAPIVITPAGKETPIDHGTHVAGVIASQKNGFGSEGVAPSSTILPVQVLNNSGMGTTADVAQGILSAIEAKANIITMSLASEQPDPVLEAALNEAHQHGILTIAAAGNSHHEGDTIAYPAAYPTVFAVAASTKENTIASFSTHANYVDISAPGYAIMSCYYNDYGYMSGTSMAAPQVAGVAALLHQIVPNLTPDEYINIMTATAQDIEQPGFDVASGNGLINPVSALQYASNNNSQGMYTPKTMKMKIKSPKKIKAGKRFTMKGAVSSGETPIISQFVRITYVVKISSKKKTYISEEKPFAVVESNTSGSFSLPTKIKTKTIFTAYVDNPVPPYATPKPVLWKVKTKK